MTAIDARPLGSDDPAAEILIQTPVFRYGLKKSLLPPWRGARLVVETEDGAPVADLPFGDVKLVNGFLLFEIETVQPGVRYRGAAAVGPDRFPLFDRAELYRLAIDDPTYRTLPAWRPGSSSA